MDKLAYFFWGCYFGTTVLMLAGAAFAYKRALRRISRNAALAGLASALFVVAFLGYLPIPDGDLLARFLAHLTILTAGVLCYLLLGILGRLKRAGSRLQAALVFGALSVLVAGAGWLLTPWQALASSLAAAFLVGAFAVGSCVRSALKGDRLAWAAVSGVLCMELALAGLGWIALDRPNVPWQAHAVSALAATLYLDTMAWVLWARYSYLLDLHAVMAHGPCYDPVTRMRTCGERGELPGSAGRSLREEPAPAGVLVLTIANFYSLEKLHGQAAVNHALFVTAGRLRRSAPVSMEVARIGLDGFVLIMRNCRDSGDLIDLARLLSVRLCKPLSLHTGSDMSGLESANNTWAAELGIGVLMVSNPAAKGASAVASARAMSHAAMSYASRLAWLDHSSGEIVELPLLAPA